MLEIQPFAHAHLEEAADMVCARVCGLRAQVPLLPARYEKPASILPLLEDLAGTEEAGAAAFEKGQLLGFLAAWRIPSLHGVRSVFAPEWAHAAQADDGTRVYEALYRYLARRWAGEGYATHYISLLPNEHAALQTWHWLNFGMFEVDALRSLEAVRLEIPAPVTIREAGLEDLETVLALDHGLWDHIRSAPIFLPMEDRTPDHLREWIDDPQMHIWLAMVANEPAAYLCTGPANQDVCTLIVDQDTTSIYAAFTRPEYRRSGVAGALLNHGLASGVESGYVRCAVDYEPMNPEAASFWPRYFTPVCYSLSRTINPRFTAD